MPDTHKKVLVVHYSQTGQLNRVVESLTAPLVADESVRVDFLNVRPREPYPFPWPMLRFINAFPESNYQVPTPLEMDTDSLADDYDLVILGYQVWYLSPSIPISSFLQSELAQKLLADTPVVTAVACRNMWLQAQEKVKAHLDRLGARLIGHTALVDEAGSALSFFATPLWVLSGRKGPFWFGLIPRAGVSEADIQGAERLGRALLERLETGPLDETVWQGLGAVHINDKLIPSEKIASRSFHIWGKLFLALGSPHSPQRRFLAVFYIAFLVLMLLTVVPITAALKRLFAGPLRRRIQRQKHYYAWPSGE